MVKTRRKTIWIMLLVIVSISLLLPLPQPDSLRAQVVLPASTPGLLATILPQSETNFQGGGSYLQGYTWAG